MVVATQQPVARDLRTLMGVQYIATELERIGDYAVRIARRTAILAGLPGAPLRPEFGLMGELASQQVRDILDALIEQNPEGAREVAVEDDEGIRETLKYNLEAAGYWVTEARDGTSGLRVARTARPDLVLLDLMLPGMSGMDFCRLFRQSSRVPIIMVTAKDSEVDKVVGL